MAAKENQFAYLADINISDQKWENHFPEGIFPWQFAAH